DGEPDNHALGRSRGGFSTKIHLACDQNLQAVSFTLTAGQAGDSPQLTEVLDRIRVARPGPGRPRSLPDRVLADKAYSSQANRSFLRCPKSSTTIQGKKAQAENRTAVAERHPHRPGQKGTSPTTARPKGRRGGATGLRL